jgi:hypothetical protein
LPFLAKLLAFVATVGSSIHVSAHLGGEICTLTGCNTGAGKSGLSGLQFIGDLILTARRNRCACDIMRTAYRCAG